MYLTTHAAVGILISQSVDRPWNVFLLSFLSHFVLDFIPHGDDFGEGEKDPAKWVPKKWGLLAIIAVVDMGMLIGMLVLLYSTQSLPDMARISAGVIGAILPDFLSNVFPVVHRYTNWLTIVRFFRWLQRKIGLSYVWRGHNWFHRKSHDLIKHRLTIRQGIVFQAIIVIITLTAALGYHVRGN